MKETGLIGHLKLLFIDALVTEMYITTYHNFINMCQETIIVRTFYNVFLCWMPIDKHIYLTAGIL